MGEGQGLDVLTEASNMLSKQTGKLEKASGLQPEKAMTIEEPTIDKAGKFKMGKPSTPAKAENFPEGKSEIKKKSSRKRWKKPKDKPNRPLSAYNLFFKSERAAMLGIQTPQHAETDTGKRVHRKSHGKMGFAEMARGIGAKWKNIPEEQKKDFEKNASENKRRYAVEIAAWKKEQTTKKLKETFRTSKAEGSKEPANRACIVQSSEVTHDGVNRSKRSSMFQGPVIHRDLPSIEYLQALQDQEDELAALLGRRNLDPRLMEYPSAAEVSANAILQQFHSTSQRPQSQLFDSSAGLARYPTSMTADLPQMGYLQLEGLDRLPTSIAADFPSMGYSQFDFGLTRRSSFDMPGMGASRNRGLPSMATEFPPMGRSQYSHMDAGPTQVSSFDLSGTSASRDRIQQLRLQAAMNLSQGAGFPEQKSMN